MKGKYLFFITSLLAIIGLFGFMYFVGFVNIFASESQFLSKYNWLELGVSMPIFSIIYLIGVTIVFILIVSIMIRLIISLNNEKRKTIPDIDDFSIHYERIDNNLNIESKNNYTPLKVEIEPPTAKNEIVPVDNKIDLENEIEEKVESVVRDLYMMVRELGTSTGVSDLFEKILQKGVYLTGSARGSIMIVDKCKELCVYKTIGWKESEKAKANNIRIPLGEGISGFVAAENKRVFVTNVETYKDFEFKYKNDYLTKSFISMPINGIKKVVAVLNLTENKRGYYTMFEMEALNILTTYGSKIFELIQLKKKTNNMER